MSGLGPAEGGARLTSFTSTDIVRKLLFALRASYFDAAMLDEVVDLLMLIVKAHFTTETVRHLATFLTATLCQGEPAFFRAKNLG